MTEKDWHEGHRQRLRERFLKAGLDAFHDYEVVELLLTLGSPRRDCKLPAKEALERFGSLRGVLEATPEELQQVKGIGPANYFGIKLVQAASQRFLRERLADKPVLASPQEFFDYLYQTMSGLKKEIFKVVYLDSQNQIIDTWDGASGTVDASTVYPREIMERALKVYATGVIFAHNHPSGAVDPSPQDNLLTRDLVYAARVMQVSVLDHLIIGDNRYFSFAAAGLIARYEKDFADIRLKTIVRERRKKEF